MSEIRRKIIENGTVPLMSDEGMSALIKYSLKYFESGGAPGPYNSSRHIKLPSTKQAIEGAPVYHDSRELYPIRAKIVIALLNRMRGESYDNIRKNLSMAYPAIKTMSDIEIEQVLSIPNEKIEEALISGNLSSLPGVILHMWNNIAAFNVDYNGKISELPYEVVGGNALRPDRYRIYFNQPHDKSGYEFWGIMMQKCIERGIPFNCKTTEHLFSEEHRDRSVFYVLEEHMDIVLEILEEIAVEYPDIVSRFGSTITAGVNYSYYAVADCPNRAMTYNDFINRASRGASLCAMSEFILEDVDFIASLSPAERDALAQAADPTFYLNQIDGLRGTKKDVDAMSAINPLFAPQEKLVISIILKYAQMHNMDDDRLKMLLEERLTQFVSYTNGNNMNMPIALSGHFYDGMEAEMSSSAVPRKPVVPRPARTTTPAKSTSATPPRRVPAQPIKPLPTQNPMTPQERTEFLRDFDYELHDLFMDYLQASLKDPAGATEILLAKLDELKRKFVVAASLEPGFKSTRKYADIMKTFAKLESFKPYQNDPTKGDMINKGLKRQYYAAMYETLRPEVRKLAGSVIDVKD